MASARFEVDWRRRPHVLVPNSSIDDEEMFIVPEAFVGLLNRALRKRSSSRNSSSRGLDAARVWGQVLKRLSEYIFILVDGIGAVGTVMKINSRELLRCR